MMSVGFAGPVLSEAEVFECQQISDLREKLLLGILPHPIRMYRRIDHPCVPPLFTLQEKSLQKPRGQ